MNAATARGFCEAIEAVDHSEEIIGDIERAAKNGQRFVVVDPHFMTNATHRALRSLGYAFSLRR